MAKLNVLYLDTHLPSIDYRPYFEQIGEFSLFPWLLKRLVTRIDVRDLIVLCHDKVDRETAEFHAQSLGVVVMQTRFETRLEALADFAAAIPQSHIACFFPEFAFAPADTLVNAWDHHLTSGNQYTKVDGLPELVAVEIFETDFLAALGRIEFGGPTPSLSAVASHLVSLRGSGREGLQIRAIPFKVTPPESLDLSTPILVDTSLDVDRARQCLEDLPETYTFEALQRWGEATPAFSPPRFASSPSVEADHKSVLYISAWAGYSGAEECLRGLVQGMREETSSQYAVIGVEGLLARRIRSTGTDVFCPNWRFNQDTEAGTIFARQLLDSVNPTVIHCNSDPGLPVLLEAKRRGIPVVTHIRVIDYSRFKDAITRSDGFITVSEFARQRLVSSGIPSDRLAVVYDGVDTAQFTPGIYNKAAMRAAYGLPEQAFVALLVARLAPNKRHDLVLAAAHRAIRHIPDLHIVFVGKHGDPILLNQLINLQKELGLQSCVTWLPFQEDIRRVECAADIVVLCSDEEPLGTCILEAMALGLPSIVADSSGPQELVRNRETGVVVRAGDPDDLTSAMIEIAADEQLRHKMGRAAREDVERLFTLRLHAQAVARVLWNTQVLT